ncbi:hypothetical protein F1559_004934 [Cyanidiococcus yangmingshanensis]|uniref:Sulfhydryl oxidase n=1 Tax=Cyanidiococcus yangmingshanensis TaxID=2690220 RepID=A0A7J7IS87_9RHOD|nr:hypothetical protein F1559_004934 [Cyanidiococcus yangmingshanensis]
MNRNAWFKLNGSLPESTRLPLPSTATRRSQGNGLRFAARAFVALFTVAGLATLALRWSPWHESLLVSKVMTQASTDTPLGGAETTERERSAAEVANVSSLPPTTQLNSARKGVPVQDGKPPTRAELGRAGWTLIHTIAANYPEVPTPDTRAHARQFIQSFAALYPCPACREHFEAYVRTHPPLVDTREDFVKWSCRAHNAVNLRLGKPTIPCTDVQALDKRWRDCHCDEKEPQAMIRAARRMVESRGERKI